MTFGMSLISCTSTKDATTSSATETNSSVSKEVNDLQSKIPNLSDSQVIKLTEINAKYDKKMKDLRASGDRSQVMEKKGEIQEEKNKEVKKILTSEQYDKYLASLKQSSDGRRGQGGGRR